MNFVLDEAKIIYTLSFHSLLAVKPHVRAQKIKWSNDVEDTSVEKKPELSEEKDLKTGKSEHVKYKEISQTGQKWKECIHYVPDAVSYSKY